MTAVHLDQVSKRFAATSVVDDVSIDIDAGEFMVLVGPSGCGKSTTLRMIAGLEATSSGAIRIGDRDVTELEPRERNVAMVFQNYALYPHKTVFDNLAFGLKMRGTAKTEIQTRVNAAAAVLGIEALLKRRPRQLSGGQMQRVALGRALVREPQVFLLDEPLSNLDAKMRVSMREEIARLHTRTRASMIYVTHDQVEAMTLGDRICVMKDGRVQQVGRPLAVYDDPANAFVAAFIGSPEINLLAGTIEAGPTFRAGSLSIALDEQRFAVPGTGTAVQLGIRPEHIALAPPDPTATSASHGIVGRVALIERLGSLMSVATNTDVGRLVVMAQRDDAVRPEAPIRLVFDARHLHLFEAAGNEAGGRSPFGDTLRRPE